MTPSCDAACEAEVHTTKAGQAIAFADVLLYISRSILSAF